VTVTVPALAPGTGANGVDTGYSVIDHVSVSGSGNWCTNNVPADCNGPNGLASWIMAPNFLYQVAGTAFALVGRIGTSGPWTLVGTGPTTLTGSGELYLAMNDEVGQFGDNNGTLQASFGTLEVPGAVTPVAATVGLNKDAVWSVPIVNNSNAPATNVVVSLRARANGSTPLNYNEALMPGCSASEGDVELCAVPDIPANGTGQLAVYVQTTGLPAGTTVGGTVTARSPNSDDGAGGLGTVTMASVFALDVPNTIAPVSPTVTLGNDAVWSVPIVNNSSSPMTNVAVTLHAKANGSTPLTFDDPLMPGCIASGGAESCSLPNIPAFGSRQLVVYARTTNLGAGTAVTGDVSVTSPDSSPALGALGAVTMTSCGASCVTAVGAPGVSVSSAPGAPTDEHPTKQVVTLPTNQPGPPIAITLKSIDPGPTSTPADKLLCPTTGTKCTGQISVVAGNFSNYNNKAHPVEVQIISKWKTKVPKGRLLMMKPTGPPIQLATCVFKLGKWNTPCMKKEVVTGSAAAGDLTTIDTILFVGSDPHLARRASNLPDAPTAIKATAAKKSAVLQFKAPVVANGLITGYLVTPRIGKVAQRSVNFKGAGTKVTVKGLVSGKSYTFTIAAKNLHGISYQSIASKAVKIK
jgi:Fibronectin type III domain